MIEWIMLAGVAWLISQDQRPGAVALRRSRENVAYRQYGAAVLRSEGFNMDWRDRP